jgi:hypothetical protein
MHRKDGHVMLVTFAKLPLEFTQWMDQLYGDEWFIRQGKWIDDKHNRDIIKVYVIRRACANRFETIARIKFPQLF